MGKKKMSFSKAAEIIGKKIEKRKEQYKMGGKIGKKSEAMDPELKKWESQLEELFAEQEAQKQQNFQNEAGELMAKYGMEIPKSRPDYTDMPPNIEGKGSRYLQQTFNGPTLYRNGGYAPAFPGLIDQGWLGHTGAFGPAQNERAGGKGTSPEYMKGFNPSYAQGPFKRFQYGGNLTPFEQSYADARSQGLKTFDFEGKPYSTQSYIEKVDAIPDDQVGAAYGLSNRTPGWLNKMTAKGIEEIRNRKGLEKRYGKTYDTPTINEALGTPNSEAITFQNGGFINDPKYGEATNRAMQLGVANPIVPQKPAPKRMTEDQMNRMWYDSDSGPIKNQPSILADPNSFGNKQTTYDLYNLPYSQFMFGGLIPDSPVGSTNNMPDKGDYPSYMGIFNPSYMTGMFKRFQNGGTVSKIPTIDPLSNLGTEEEMVNAIAEAQIAEAANRPKMNKVENPFDDPDFDYYGRNKRNKGKFSTKDLATYAPVAYNAAMGLFGQIDPAEEIVNPYEGQIKDIMSKRAYDPTYAKSKNLSDWYEFKKAVAGTGAKSYQEAMNMMQKGYAKKRQQDLAISDKEQLTKLGLEGEKAKMLAALGESRRRGKEIARKLDVAAETNLAQYLPTALGQASKIAQGMSRDKTLANILKEKYPNYEIQKDGTLKHKRTGRIKTNWMKEIEGDLTV